MGYSEDDFPRGPFSKTWRSLLWQPRELTEQGSYAPPYFLSPGIYLLSAWKRLLPQLEEHISKEAKRKKWLRRHKRMYEVDGILKACLTELPSTGERVLTTYAAIRESEEISKLVDENDAAMMPITRENIEAILPDILKRQTDKNVERYTDALRHALSPDPLGDGAELPPLPDLKSVVALFPCSECDNKEVARNYTLTELVQHTKQTHLVGGAHKGVKSVDEALQVDRTHFHVDTVRQVLRMLGLSEDTRYEAVSGKVICLCSRFTSEQPVHFSALVRPSVVIHGLLHEQICGVSR